MYEQHQPPKKVHKENSRNSPHSNWKETSPRKSQFHFNSATQSAKLKCYDGIGIGEEALETTTMI